MVKRWLWSVGAALPFTLAAFWLIDGGHVWLGVVSAIIAGSVMEMVDRWAAKR